MTNLNIAKLYLAANAGTTATALDAAIADTSANTAVQALTTAAFVEAAYQTAFGRSADAEGLAYWSDRIDNGGMAKDDAFMTALNYGATVYVAPTVDAPLVIGTETFTAATAEGVNDVAVAANKASIEASAVEAGTAVSVGTAAEIVATVTEDAATVTSANGTISTAVTASIVTNTDALLLTTSSDLIVGTAGDDSINALVGTVTATGVLSDTYQSVDIIDGGAGTDTMNISLSTQTGINPGATVTNVEKINYTEYSTVGLNMANITGVETLTLVNSIAAAVVSNVGENLDVVVQNSNVANTVGFTGAALNAGTTDSVNLTLSKVGNSAAVSLNHTTGANDFETVNITSTGGANDVVFAGTAVDAATTMNIAGEQSLKVTATALTLLKTVDASATTAGVNMNVTGATAQNMTITGGTGDDTIIMAGLSDLDTINGGAGTDTLVARLTGTVATAAAISEVEVVSLSASAASSINLANATSLTTVAFTPASADLANLVSVTNAAATAKNIMLSGTGVTTAETHAGASFALKTSTATDDSLAITIDNKTATGVHTQKADGTVLTVGAITANGIEALTINTADLGDTLVVGATTTVGGTAITALNATAAKTLSVTSDTYVSIGNALSATMKTVDASAATGGINLNIATMADSTATAVASTSVTTGSGNDTLGTVNITANVNKAVSTGAGKDTLTLDQVSASTQGVVTIDMGAGDDTVTVDPASNASAGTAAEMAKAGSTLSFGEGTDTLKSGTQDANLTNYTISGLEKVQILSTKDVNVNAADVTGTVIELSDFNTGYLDLVGTTGDDAIDASTFVINGTAGVVINGAGGADTLSGTTGIDAFSLAAHTLVGADIDLTEVSTITNFEAQDFLTFGGDFAGATAATTFSAGTVVDITAAGNATFIAALNAALLADTSGGAKEGHVFSVTSSDSSVTGAVGSYAVFNTGTDTAFTSGADFIVKITGTLPAAANDFDVA